MIDEVRRPPADRRHTVMEWLTDGRLHYNVERDQYWTRNGYTRDAGDFMCMDDVESLRN